MTQRLSVSGTSRSPTSVSTSCEETDNNHDLWTQALEQALSDLPAEDSRWLSQEQNRTAFTSTQMVEAIRPLQEQYTNHRVQRFFAKIDPIVSHVRAFAGVLTVFANANPVGAGITWGCVYLVLIAAGNTHRLLDRILNILSELSPQLGLFSRWHRLFPQKSFVEVGDAIKESYSEIIGFCVTAVRYLRRRPIVNVARTIISSSMERALEKYDIRLRRCTARVRNEVDTAHMQFVQTQLSAISSIIELAPTPRYLELPVIRIIPHSRNERFFGRQSILDQMRRHLLLSKPQNQRKFALSGLGGTGKTQIALEYTYRHLDDYKVVIWILADSQEKIVQGFEETANLLGMPRGTQSALQVKSFVLQRLSATNESYLLCFDNADDLSLVRDCFPRDNIGTVLLTSRDSVATEEITANRVIVPEFSLSEGCDFLSSLLPDRVMSNPGNRAILQDISDTFHGYPLALAQAAGFIRTGGCPLADFLKIIQDRKSSTIVASMPISDYHATLLTVLDLSFQSLNTQSRKILEVLVYLDPDSVSYELLEKGCVAKSTDDDHTSIDLSFMADPVNFWAALKNLRSQSLIRTNPELKTISIHRFLQNQAFHHLCAEPGSRRRAFEESLFLLQNRQPEFPNLTQHWSPDLFKDSEMCLPHIKRLAAGFLESPETFTGLENKLGKVIFECASYQFQRFHHQASTETFALARSVIGRAKSPNELILSDCYRMEGRMFNESGQPSRAAKSNREAQKYALEAISKGYIGKDDQRMPLILTGLGNSLSQLQEYDDALTAQLEAKKLCGDVPPEQSDAITIIQLNWGFLLYRRGDLKSAEQVLRATLEANPKTPAALYALGNTLLARGEIEEAIAVHLEGLKIYIAMFGDQHALVGRCAYKVGEILLLHKSDSKTARRYIREAIKIYLKQESSYYTVKAYARGARMMAKAFEKEGRYHEADEYFNIAWTLREKIDGVHGSPTDEDSVYSSVMFYWDQ